jgi:hypothetical protein
MLELSEGSPSIAAGGCLMVTTRTICLSCELGSKFHSGNEMPAHFRSWHDAPGSCDRRQPVCRELMHAEEFLRLSANTPGITNICASINTSLMAIEREKTFEEIVERLASLFEPRTRTGREPAPPVTTSIPSGSRAARHQRRRPPRQRTLSRKARRRPRS